MAGTSLLRLGMVIASEAFVFVIPIGLVAGWLAGYREDSVVAFTVVLVGLAVSYVFGLTYQHSVPSQVSQAMVSKPPADSFPSQHTAVMATFTWALVGLQYRRTASVVSVLTVLVGIGRVFVGHHYPVDIIGGVVASLIGVALTYPPEPYIRRVGAWAAAIDDWARDALFTS